MAQTHSLFFYGTLVHAAVLSRVIGNPGEHLETVDAILQDHVRLHVDGEDYPAVIAADDGARLLNRPLTDDEASVRGVLVQGLTDDDVALLDEFEGDEYTRSPCTVTPIASSPAPSRTPLQATVYLWTAPHSRLSPSIWTFEAFLRDSAHRWVGVGSENNPDYAEVDRRRQMKGVITPRGVQESAADALEQVDERLEVEKEKLQNHVEHEPFGRALRTKYWGFDPDYVPLNHGSYGAAPRPVMDRFRALQDASIAAPDRFMKVDYEPLLVQTRQRLADFVKCDRDDLVVVTNATMGVNTVLRSLSTTWEKGDRLLCVSTTMRVLANGNHIVDSHPHLELSLLSVELTYPVAHADVLSAVRAAVETASNDGSGRRIRLALVDGISANPGTIVPWRSLVSYFRTEGILSLVDAAHEFGQVPISLRDAQPDFYVSNVHKWGLGHRTAAVLYVDKRWQHLVHSIPTSHAYAVREPGAEGEGCPGWVDEHVWTGTIEWASILSIPAALDFRERVLGGEERIIAYCHGLAIDGGELVAKELGTQTMRNASTEEGELVACMVNVQLPLPAPSSYTPAQRAQIVSWWNRELTYSHRTFVPIFPHDDKYWVRISAQVYTDMDDFRYGASALKTVCEQIRAGAPFRNGAGEQ
ncbi:hypothetical protein Rhopal_007272-T1 [Rhodotorula paludigena]|uniref:Pyridoxal phosphate-dependent transferase n=1 Tax=Rhodotorula paludigena TaxID=86838 RepID=A0AAV5GVA2_9BASI|nr:hypothetical protein Rhopal_007272-T1 [Rhodotorula paludigena]